MTMPTRDELLKLDAAFDDEIKRVSTLEYNSNEICRSFYGKLRERYATFLYAHQAQAAPEVAKLIDKLRHDARGRHAATVFDLDKAADTLEALSQRGTPPSSDQTWNEAIEAAAKQVWVFDERKEIYKAIQALARPSQAQEPAELSMSMFANRDEYESARMAQAQEPSSIDPRFAAAHYGNDLAPEADVQPVSGAVDEREAFAQWVRKTYDYPASCDPLLMQGAMFYAWQAGIAFSRTQQAPAVSDERLLSTDEQKFILSAPAGIGLLMAREDLRYTEAAAQLEPSEMGEWPTKRWSELRDMGRRIVADDPEIWTDDVLREFGVVVAAPVSTQSEWMRPKFVTKDPQ